jgi:hypothetical protein
MEASMLAFANRRFLISCCALVIAALAAPACTAAEDEPDSQLLTSYDDSGVVPCASDADGLHWAEYAEEECECCGDEEQCELTTGVGDETFYSCQYTKG